MLVRPSISHTGMTLRQIEVLRAVMLTGSLVDAGRLLNVSPPGLSRLVKYVEQSLGFRLFDRNQGRLIPTPMSRGIFERINDVISRVEDLREFVLDVKNGAEHELRIGCAPSLANGIAPRAIAKLRRIHPRLKVDLKVLKAAQAVDALLLGNVELVALDSSLDHPIVDFRPMASGELYCIVPEEHEFASLATITIREIARRPMIGHDRDDPIGQMIAALLSSQALSCDIAVQAHSSSATFALARAGLGVGIVDQFTVADMDMRGLKALRIEETTLFMTGIACKSGGQLSCFGEQFGKILVGELADVVQALPAHLLPPLDQGRRCPQPISTC